MASSLLVEAAIIVAATVANGKGATGSIIERAARDVLRPPDVVQGAIIVAVGSSFPEVATVVVAALGGSVAGRRRNRRLGHLQRPRDSGAVGARHRRRPRNQSPRRLQGGAVLHGRRPSRRHHVLACGHLLSRATPRLTALSRGRWRAIPLGLYGLYRVHAVSGYADHDTERTRTAASRSGGSGSFFCWAWLSSSWPWRTSSTPSSHRSGRRRPEFLLGVTILAAATSLPDTLVSVRAARRRPRGHALANVLGSNTFDLLVATRLAFSLPARGPSTSRWPCRCSAS